MEKEVPRGVTCEPRRSVDGDIPKEDEPQVRNNKPTTSGLTRKGEESKAKPVVPRYQPPIPFPQRLVNIDEIECKGKVNKLLRKLILICPFCML